MITGGEVSLGLRITGYLGKVWKRYNPFGQMTELRERVAALEKALERCPGEACPFCGARSWRLKVAEMQGTAEDWHCLECKKEREYRYNRPGQLPPGVKTTGIKEGRY
jgi:hypothetical protein